MVSGYKILWTNHALKELKQTYEYLEIHFTSRELEKLSSELEHTLKLISQNPELFPICDSRKIRKVVILKFNSLYYRVHNNQVEILSFFSNRQHPNKRKL